MRKSYFSEFYQACDKVNFHDFLNKKFISKNYLEFRKADLAYWIIGGDTIQLCADDLGISTTRVSQIIMSLVREFEGSWDYV